MNMTKCDYFSVTTEQNNYPILVDGQIKGAYNPANIQGSSSIRREIAEMES